MHLMREWSSARMMHMLCLAALLESIILVHVWFQQFTCEVTLFVK